MFTTVCIIIGIILGVLALVALMLFGWFWLSSKFLKNLTKDGFYD